METPNLSSVASVAVLSINHIQLEMDNFDSLLKPCYFIFKCDAAVGEADIIGSLSASACLKYEMGNPVQSTLVAL